MIYVNFVQQEGYRFEQVQDEFERESVDRRSEADSRIGENLSVNIENRYREDEDFEMRPEEKRNWEVGRRWTERGGTELCSVFSCCPRLILTEPNCYLRKSK